MTFITILCSYISDTYTNFMSSGFSDDAGWYLVTQLVNYLFSDDMDKNRSFVQEAFDSENMSTMATAVMWRVFKTHSVMEKCLYFKSEHHPSITSEYTKILVSEKISD